MSKNILVLNFGGRPDGNCNAVSAFIENFYNRTNVRLYNIANKFMSSCGNCNYECLREGARCRIITDEEMLIYDAVCKSDIVYYIIPNYCGFPCANYFIFNERSAGYFNKDQSLLQDYMSVKKCFIIISNSVETIFDTAAKQQTENPEILYLKSKEYGKKSVDGDILDSSKAQADLLAYLSENDHS